MSFFTDDVKQRLHEGAKTFDIAHAVGCTIGDVARIARSNGYSIRPSGTLAKDSTPAPDYGRAHTERIVPIRIPEEAQPMTTPTPAAPRSVDMLAESNDPAVFLRRYGTHENAKVARAAGKALDAYTNFTKVLLEWQEKADARKEIAALEAKLAEAKAKLNGHRAPGRRTEAPDGIDWKAVRAWAAENGVECSEHGRVPQRVVDAYLEAQAA